MDGVMTPPVIPKRLTFRQRQVLRCVVQFIEDEGFPPTLRELGDVLGMRSTNGVSDVLDALVHKGYLRRLPLKSRGIRVLHPDGPLVNPLVHP